MKKLRLLISIFVLLLYQDRVFSKVYTSKKNNSRENSNFLNHLKNSNNLYESNKSKFTDSITKNNFDSLNADYLGLFFNNLVSNLGEISSDKKNKISEIEIFSDIKKFEDQLLFAEGNVIIKTKNAILRSDTFSYDQDLETIILTGNIKFKSKNSFLEATNIEYDFINKKGFILNAYGAADFKDISKLTLSDSVKKKKKLNENFVDINRVKNVKYNTSSNIKLGNIVRKYEDDKSFRERLFDQSLEVNFNNINKTRFIAERIDINNNEWFSKQLTLTSDPFNKPQLIIKNKNFKTNFNEDNTKIRSNWSTAFIENKLPIPLGPRRIDVDKNQNFKWGNGYDKNKFDGFYAFRKFNQIEFDNNTELDISTIFPLQRIVTGETKAFPNNEALTISPKVKKDANFYDFFGIRSFLKREMDNWKFILDVETNSLDFEKLDKATELESYLTVNLFEEDSNKNKEEEEEEEQEILDDDKSKNSFKLSKDLTFFGNYRDKTKNGSLGDIVIKSAYGTRYDIFRNKTTNNTNIVSEKSLAFGNYESSSKLNSAELINKNRINFSYKKKYEYALWKPEIRKYINNEYKYSPIVIPRSLYWDIEGSLDIFRYDGGYEQDVFTIKTGPRLILGDLKGNFLDYTEISILPRFKFNRGESPFNFDQVVDKKAIEIKASQHLYGPLIVSFSGEISLDKSTSNNDKLINPVIDLAWSRRAYYINLFYNLDSEVGGINFKINTFNFKGAGDNFQSKQKN